MAETYCSVDAGGREARAFLYPKYITTLNGVETFNPGDNFVAEVKSQFGENNYIAFQQIQELLTPFENKIDLTDEIQTPHRQLHEKFKNWELKDTTSIIDIFGDNTKLSDFIITSFNKDAFKYCIVNNTTTDSPLVVNSEQLSKNIAKFKQNLILKILPAARAIDPSLRAYSQGVLFHSEFGADCTGYNRILSAFKTYLQQQEDFTVDEKDNIKLNDFDMSQDGADYTASLLYAAFALVNFDKMLDNSMEGIVKASSKEELGNLNRHKYSLSSDQNAEGESDTQGFLADRENVLNFVSKDMVKVIASIPMVSYNLNTKGKNAGIKRLNIFADGSNLQIPHILQLSQWIQLHIQEFSDPAIFGLPELDLQKRPVHTIKTILKAIHDGIVNYDPNSPVGKFIKEKNAKGAIQTALSVYEYFFNNTDRIVASTYSIDQINNMPQYNGMPEFNLINLFTQQLLQSSAPAYIEHNMNGTIWDQQSTSGHDTVGKNMIQRFESNNGTYAFIDPVRQCVFHEAAKGKSEIAEAIIRQTGGSKTKGQLDKSFKLALQTNEYLEAMKSLLGLQTADNKLLRQLLGELDDRLDTDLLKNLFLRLAADIQSIGASQDSYKYWKSVDSRVNSTLQTFTKKSEVAASILTPLFNITPTPTFQTREGNQQGVYRTTSLIFMMDHLIKRYKYNKDEPIENGIYKLVRKRSNIFVDCPELFQPGNNAGYQSSVAIPLTMGTADTNLEARKQPEFIQQLHAFVGEYMSLMLGVKDDTSSPVMAFQLGTYSDKTTLLQQVINGSAQLGNTSVQDLLSDTTVLLRVSQAYQAVQSLDITNHIIDDWVKIFQEALNDVEYEGSEESQAFLAYLRSDEVQLKLAQIVSIQSDLYSDEIGSNNDLFKALMSNPKNSTRTFKEFMGTTGNNPGSVANLYLRLKANADILNSIFQNPIVPMPKSFLLEVIPQLGQKTGVKVVHTLYADTYKFADGEKYNLNRVLLDDLQKNCTPWESYKTPFDEEGNLVEPLNVPATYNQRMAIQALNREYYIDGKEQKFFDYLYQYFTDNANQFIKMIGKQTKSTYKNRVKLFDNLYVKDGNTYVVSRENLAKIFFQYLTFTNFLRHQALDLGVKEAYCDKAKHKDWVDPSKDLDAYQKALATERSERVQTTGKRNNTYTATIIPFIMDLVDGVSSKTKICVIQDLKGGVFNTIGIDTTLNEWDGLGLNSPLQVRMEDKSLSGRHRISTKKTFITPVNDYSAEELKWATNEITNKKIRESQGSAIPLLSVFKRMHNIEFDYDITLFWENDGPQPIIIESLIGKKYFARDGFKIYQYKTITNTGNNTYKISRVEVDASGKPIADASLENVKINSIYGIYEALNGINAMEMTPNGFQYSESIMDLLYQLTWRVGEQDETEEISQAHIRLPLRESFIGILVTEGANKRGFSNMVTNKAWTNSNIPLSYTEIEMATGGKQLDAEHEADESTITKGTQLMQDIAQKGYTSELVEEVYKAIAKVMDHSSPEFNELSKKAQQLEEMTENMSNEELLKSEGRRDIIYSIQKDISNKIVKLLKLNGLNTRSVNLINRFIQISKDLKEDFVLPLSLLTKEVVKSYATELNKNVIKQQDSGLMGTLNGASGFVQTYNIDGQTYTMDNFLDLSSLERISKYSDSVDLYCQSTGYSKDEAIKVLSILDRMNVLEEALDFFGQKPANQLMGPNMVYTLLDFYRGNQPLRYQAIGQINPAYLGLTEIPVSRLKPGYTVVTASGKKVLIDSMQKILSLQNEGSVYIDNMTPTDLLPQILEVETLGHIENEYTSVESLFSARIKRGSKLKGTDVYLFSHESDILAISNIVNYLSLFDQSEKFQELVEDVNNNLVGHNMLHESSVKKLAEIQESMLNFKNHVKSFGYNLVPIDFSTQNAAEYYLGFNPMEDFSKQLQENIVTEDFFIHPISGDVLENPLLSEYDQDGREVKSAISKAADAILFYANHQADALKLQSLRLIFGPQLEKLQGDYFDAEAVEAFIEEHPQFFFKAYSYQQSERYSLYMEKSPMFEKIVHSDLQVAQIVMPFIYSSRMHIGNTKLKDVTADTFASSRAYYDLQSQCFDGDGKKKWVNVDFAVRTFRGGYNIVVSTDLTDPKLEKYGTNITETNVTVDEEGYRINPRNNQRMYKLPPKGTYAIYHTSKLDTIVLLNLTDKSIEPLTNVNESIKALLNSDAALISIQPFCTNMMEQQKNSELTELLRSISSLNTMPTFNKMFDAFYNVFNLQDPEAFKSTLYDMYVDLKAPYQRTYRNSLYQSFLRSLDVIATRIPTQNMSSIMPMKIAQFTGSNVNDVFVTKWQQWLLGAKL